jgi:Uma2 family endonuclease
MMAGAKPRHDQVVVNAIGALVKSARRRPVPPVSVGYGDPDSWREHSYAEAGVDCGDFDDEATWAAAPRLVIEVLSASTRDFDLFTKLEEYKSVPSIQNIIFVIPMKPNFTLSPRQRTRLDVSSDRRARIHPRHSGHRPIIGAQGLVRRPNLRPKPRLIYGEAEQV